MAKRMFKKNDLVTLNIEDITDLGFGVGKIDGAVVFVGDTVPGDVIEAKIIKANASYLVGRVEKYIKKSEMRYDGRCSEDRCHSCAYKCISYAEEARLKEEGVRRLFSRETLAHIRTMPITSSPREVRYRNKAQYPIAFLGGRYEVGFFAPKSHRVTPICDCPLTPKVFSDIVEVLKGYFADYSLPVYDEESGKGLLRHIYLRRGEVSGEVLLTLVVTDLNIPSAPEMAQRIQAKFPEVVGVLLNKNDKATNVVLGEEYKCLFGRDYIYDTLGGVRLKITAPSFYQVNHEAAEILYQKARELAEPSATDTLLDLYCGAGSIGLSMAKAVKELIGIEIVESAVECAKENAAANGIENAKFFVGDAKNTEDLLLIAERELGRKIAPDIIILDPPRGGCDEALVRYAARLAPRKIVYISCNPKTLARDVELFETLGYGANEVYPVDLFPMTGHVENVVCLTRSDKAT